MLGLTALAATASPAVAATNDPLRAKQWGLTQVRAEQAWPTSRGAGTTIAVVDTGVDLAHPDLAAQLVPGATFVGCAGGATVCSDGSWKGVDGVGQAPDSHGTHVVRHRGGDHRQRHRRGRASPPTPRIMPIKVLEDGSGSTADIARGIRWAADHGADVINLSLGSLPGTQVLSIVGLDTAIEEAIDYARTKGAVSVVAAGNTSTIACTSPGFSSSGICVGSTDKQRAALGLLGAADQARPQGRLRAAAASPSVAVTTTCGRPSRPRPRAAAGSRATTRSPAPPWRPRTSPVSRRCSSRRVARSTRPRRRILTTARTPVLGLRGASSARSTATASSTPRQPSRPRADTTHCMPWREPGCAHGTPGLGVSGRAGAATATSSSPSRSRRSGSETPTTLEGSPSIAVT